MLIDDEILLDKEGEKEAERYIESFKIKMKKICEETLGEVYVNCMPYIASDSWVNFRNHTMQWVRGYKKLSPYDAKEVREAILKNHREQIIADLNQDLLEEVEKLKRWREEDRQMRSGY